MSIQEDLRHARKIVADHLGMHENQFTRESIALNAAVLQTLAINRLTEQVERLADLKVGICNALNGDAS